MNKFKPKTGRIPLDSVFSEYQKISEAPTLADLAEEAMRMDQNLNYLISLERQKLYKSQNAFGEVFLIQNPAVWNEERRNGMVFRQRPRPRLVIHNGEHVAEVAPSNQDSPAIVQESTKKIIGGFF